MQVRKFCSKLKTHAVLGHIGVDFELLERYCRYYTRHHERELNLPEFLEIYIHNVIEPCTFSHTKVVRFNNIVLPHLTQSVGDIISILGLYCNIKKTG